MNKDRLAARLLATFLGELAEQLRVMNADVLALEAEPTSAERLNSLFRVVHTLKGAARAAGVPLIEVACHALEGLLARARDRKIVLGPEEFALLYAAADGLADAGERIQDSRELTDSPLDELVGRLNQRLSSVSRPDHTIASPTHAAPVRARDRTPPSLYRQTTASPESPPASPEPPAPRAPARGGEQVRVQADKLDALLAASSEVLLASQQIAEWPAELREIRDLVAEQANEWRRGRLGLHRAAKEAELPSAVLHAVARMEESMQRLVHSTTRLTRQSAQDVRALSRAADAITGDVRRLRMRPFADACEALPRLVRDLGGSAGKEVQLELRGGEVEADREVLDALRDALLHLVRNAVDHGIEPPRERETAGKARAGRVTVAAELKGDRITVTVADDGAGLDVAALGERLEEQGAPIPADERDLVQALFQGGVSTRAEANMISGRGVGLDSVRSTMERMRGSVDVSWEKGRGTEFTLECPPALATIRAVIMKAGSQLLVIPTLHIERLMRLRPEEIRRAGGRDVILSAEAPIPLLSLARLLGAPVVEQPVTGPVPIVSLLVGGRRIAVVVDELLTEQDVLVRPVNSVRSRSRYLSGATLLGQGRVALVLNSAALVTDGLREGVVSRLRAVDAKASATRRRILVVDDSITTRTLEQSILEAAGYEVLTAVDGADAWQIVRESACELVVSDIEMPNMDGFALCQAIRASERHKDLPVVLVTSLESPEHRSRGLEAGADAYVTKSSFNQQDLLDTIRQLLG